MLCTMCIRGINVKDACKKCGSCRHVCRNKICEKRWTCPHCVYRNPGYLERFCEKCGGDRNEPRKLHKKT